MQRLGIYLIYDKEKIVDSYIGYMLRELKACIDHLVVVCNMPEVIYGADILKQYADEVFYRENIGFDAGGFKAALCKFLGWDKVLKYEELFLINDSMFGPFYPMKHIFDKMDNKPVDFWGLTKHGEFIRQDKKYIEEHIQTFFLGIRSRMLHSACFRKYWEALPYYKDFGEVVWEHETKFTQYFARLGYSYDIFADVEINNSEVNIQNNYSQYALLSFEMLKKRGFPFLKKQPIVYDTLAKQTQENLRQSLDYIDRETDYDVDLIWENLIRTVNMADIQRNLHLQYIISPKEERTGLQRNTVIVIFAEYKEAVEYIWEYLQDLWKEPDFTVEIISENEEILETYKEYIIDWKNIYLKQYWDLEVLVQYDFVCVLHDADMISDRNPSCTGKSYFYCIWENLFKDKDHIAGILEKFEKEKRLGFLAPPQPYFGDYFGDLGSSWGKNYVKVEKIVKKLQLQSPISMEKPPFCAPDNFWIRGNILECFKGLSADEYEYLPYLWCYFAQHMGYYSGIVESADYASMNEVNMQYYLKQIVGQAKSEYGDFKNINELRAKMTLGALKLYCEKYPRILMYGAGYYAKKYLGFLSRVEACIVSDNQRKMDSFEGIPVMYLSEVRNLAEYGIVLCLNKANQREVIPFLEQYGVTNYFCIS